MTPPKKALPTERPDAAATGVPTIALALGGGGARGLAHIVMLEAFDELGIRPKVISGTSIGAIFGAAYASGLSARDIRSHTHELLSARFDLLRDLFNARARGTTQRLRDFFAARVAILSPEALLEVLLPATVARDFSELEIPLKIVASDFYALQPRVFTAGPLRTAVAASMALPVIFEPVVVDGRALIDGGLTNPLPFDLLIGEADITVAIDVSGAPVPAAGRERPTATEALFASAFIFERTINREKLKSLQPDIYVDAGTSHFQVLDILRVKEILAAAEPAKEKLKAKLGRLLEAKALPPVAPPEMLAELAGYASSPELDPDPGKPRRRLLKPLKLPALKRKSRRKR
ncbi:MAG: patatin-like phospholipase family protein [Hyphomicrobium sp.]